MGLTVTQKIVDTHDGSLTIQSTVGVGTAVEIRIPGKASANNRDRQPRARAAMRLLQKRLNAGLLPLEAELRIISKDVVLPT